MGSMCMSSQQINEAVQILQRGGVIAYPTEAVFGLGCDPNNEQAVERLLAIKQRSRDKGLILIAADFQQLTPFLAEIDDVSKEQILATWPGPVTWVWPAKPEVSKWLRGEHDTIAVRVTGHPLAAALCRGFGGPLVSTSANLSGKSPAKTEQEVRQQFHEQLDYIVVGELGGREKPSQIRDVMSGKVLR